MHGTRDGIIPFDMSKRLAQIAGDRATFVPVDCADPNDLFDVGGPEMFATIAQFIDRVATASPSGR